MPLKLLLGRCFRKNRKFIITLFLISFFLIVFLIIKFLFQIKEIEIEGDNSLIIGIESLAKKNLLFLNAKEVEKKIKTYNPQIVEVNLIKFYPQRIKLIIKTYKSEAVLAATDSYFFLSEDGRVLFKSKKQDQNLPLISYYQKFNSYSYQPGDWITFKDLLLALRLLKILQGLGVFPEGIDIKGENMILFKIGEKKIILSADKDIETVKYQLTKIIKQFKIEGKEFKALDLRFDKPIISF